MPCVFMEDGAHLLRATVALLGHDEIEEHAALVIAGHLVRIPIELRISLAPSLRPCAPAQRALQKLQQNGRAPLCLTKYGTLHIRKVIPSEYAVQVSQRWTLPELDADVSRSRIASYTANENLKACCGTVSQLPISSFQGCHEITSH